MKLSDLKRGMVLHLRDSERAKGLIKSHEKELKIYYEVEE